MSKASRSSTTAGPAVHSGNNPASRRDLAGMAGAMLLLMGAAGPGKAAELDGALLDTFRRWQPWKRERRAVFRLPDNDPTYEARFDAFARPWHDLVHEITDLPARTPEGIQAKATVLRATLLNHVLDEHDGEVDTTHATTSETLAWSLVQDMLGRAVA